MLCKLALVVTTASGGEPRFSDPNVSLPLGPIVDTEFGMVEGSTSIEGLLHKVDRFFGIPFAAAPVGENRLRPPQPFAKPWKPLIRQADIPGSLCPQLDLVGNLGLGKEDCLYLNVYRPWGATKKSNLPVFFWIYGGAYILGDGYEFTMYDGVNLVHRHHEMVVVTSNYRLSGLGFFALPELQAENADATTGNYALQDQRAALQFVQRNILGFGGDPSQVTIAGESAGAFSVQWHLASPASRGLFHAAIAESGTSHLDFVFQNLTEAFTFYEEYSTILGCPPGDDRVSCLRSLKPHDYVISIAQIVQDAMAQVAGLPLPKNVPALASPLFPAMPFGPVVDGSLVGLPDVPLTMFKRGDFAKVPLILGSNKDGGAYFGPILPVLWGDFLKYDVKAFSTWFFKKAEDQVRFVELYGGDDFEKDMPRFDQAFRDMLFTCSNREVARTWQGAGLPTYLYMFSFDFAGIIGSTIGDAHALELPFVWQNYAQVLGDLTDFDIFGHKYQDMANIMSSTWASFVKCQEPRCETPPPHTDALDKLPVWPKFEASAPLFYSLRHDPVVESIQKSVPYHSDEFPGDDRCDFWATAELDLVNWKKARNAYFTQAMRSHVTV
jgi:para-nitrobenzyl esterase